MSTDILTRSAPEPSRVLRYEPHADGVIDMYWPPGNEHAEPDEHAEHAENDYAAKSFVVLLHGGFWRARYDRRHLRALAAACAGRGALVAVPEFRRVGGGGEWPVIGQDVEAALNFLEAAFPWVLSYTLVGHSSGGHLAMWAGLRAGPARVHHIVALAPVCDLRRAHDLDLSNGAVADLLGGTPTQRPDAYADADPLRHLPTRAAVTIVQGTDDVDVPAELNRDIAARFPTVSYRELPGMDHFSLIDPLSKPCQDVVLPAIFDRGASLHM